jgi:UDP-glucuronate decarboxylase
LIAQHLPTDIDEIIDGLGDAVSRFAGKTILITGGMGFLGRYFTAMFERLNETRYARPCRLVVLDNLITSRGRAVRSTDLVNGVFHKHDITKPFECDEPIDFVLHVAGIASPYYYRAYPLETLEVATLGTKNMLEIARQNSAQLVFFSSSEIYGDPDPQHVPTPESYRGNVSCQGPRACYDESKRVGETLCYVYHEKFGVHVNTVRPFNVFGPGMPETDYRVLPNFASRIVNGQRIQVYGSGNQTRTYCYVTDAMAGFLKVLALGVPGEVYNVGTPDPEISVLDLVSRIQGVLDREVPHDLIEHPDSYPADEPRRRCPDIRKARLQLGYEPTVKLDDGLRRYFDWAAGAYAGADSG